jgi:hypothetical protein
MPMPAAAAAYPPSLPRAMSPRARSVTHDCGVSLCHVSRCTPSCGSRVVALPDRSATALRVQCTCQQHALHAAGSTSLATTRPRRARAPTSPRKAASGAAQLQRCHLCERAAAPLQPRTVAAAHGGSRARWQPRTVAATCTSGRSRRNVARTPHGRRAATPRRSSRSLSCGANSRTTSASTTLRPRPWLPSGPMSCSLASHLRQDRAHSTPRLPRDGPLHRVLRSETRVPWVLFSSGTHAIFRSGQRRSACAQV